MEITILLKRIAVQIKSDNDYNFEIRNLHLSTILKRENKDIAVDFGIENFFIQEQREVIHLRHNKFLKILSSPVFDFISRNTEYKNEVRKFDQVRVQAFIASHERTDISTRSVVEY